MTQETTKRKLLIAGGGTGGHLFPAVAVAEEFLSRSLDHEVLFINAGRPLDRKILGKKGLNFVTVSITGLNRVGWLQKAKSLFLFPFALYQALSVVRAFEPQVLFSVGGYSAAPAALAAKIMGLPLLLHEQNSIPGLTTRILARFADEAHVSFPGTPLPLDEKKYFVSGNPVREELLFCRKRRRGKNAAMNLLILGGSQGAHAINEIVCQSLPLLKLLGIRFVHQTGTAELEKVKEAYKTNGVEAEILPFIEDMKTAYAQADLVFCRAGATTVAELTAAGLGAVLVPFPAAADNHQFQNAKTLADAGAGIIVEERSLDQESLAALLSDLARNPEKTEEMARKALLLAPKNAAKKITNAIMQYMPE